MSTQFVITDNAAIRIKDLAYRDSLSDAVLRLKVEGGGCSGFRYDFSLAKNIENDDKIFSHKDVKVVIDELSLPFIDGSVLDYVETLTSAEFVVKNPNASASCGCGNSFAV